jgi:hypothetical protein
MRPMVAGTRPGRDAAVLIAAQAVRAAGYGFTAVLLGALLADRGYSNLRAAVVLTALIAGTALSSLLVGAATPCASPASPPPARWSPPGPRSGCCWSSR